jgi:hypothetical protein
MPYPTQVLMYMPSGDLVDKFAPQDPCLGDGCPYQPNNTFHCFDFNDEGTPNYVRGLAQGYWFFSGPVAPDQLNVLAVYANDPTDKQFPLVGYMTIKYASDFMSASNITVTCQPSSWCSLWPSELVNGVELSTTTYPTTTYCLYDPASVAGTYTDLLSEWTSAQGTTWMCLAPQPDENMAVNGSWNFVNNADECASRGETYPCLNNSGTYYNAIAGSQPNGAGIVITQWYGWNFGTQNGNGVVDGRSLFTASSDTAVTGSYCVFNDTLGIVEYCYPEAYTKIGPSTPATCATFLMEAPTMTPTMAPTAASGTNGGSDDDSVPRSEANGLIAAVVILFFVGMAIGGMTMRWMGQRGSKKPMASEDHFGENKL